ncbi:hypothetical protein V8E55_011944 [Tylopilus felleus]
MSLDFRPGPLTVSRLQTFYEEYKCLECEFHKPILDKARKSVDSDFFQDWTDVFVTHFQGAGKKNAHHHMEYFTSSNNMERGTYKTILYDFWNHLIMVVEVPAKLKALKHGPMEMLHPDQLMHSYPYEQLSTDNVIDADNKWKCGKTYGKFGSHVEMTWDFERTYGQDVCKYL